MSVAPEAARPGRTFFAPDVRVCKLGALGESGEAGEELTSERFDVTAVEITRINTGVSQYNVTINNWIDSLPGEGESAARRWPPFKYNDFETFVFGQRLRIDLRYWPDPADELTEPVQAVHRWVPLVSGPITDMKYTFSSGEGARLQLIGEDDLYPLKNKSREKVTYKKKTEKHIIEDVLERAQYPLSLSQPEVPWPDFFTNGSKGLSETLQEGQSFLEFLQKIAKKFDCEVFAEFDDLAAEEPAVGFHFAPARSQIRPDDNSRHLYILQRGKNLIEFTPTFKVFDQYTKVTVKGRHRARNRPTPVRQGAEPAILVNELHRDESRGDPELTSGPAVRQRYFGPTFGANEHQLPNQSNVDEERATAMAEAVLRQKAREFMGITGTTVGLPHLRPGVYVEIQKMRPPFDGFYYVEKTVARFGADGFTTQFTARRPGMPLPPYQES